MNMNDQIQQWIKETYGIRGIKGCYISDVKERVGLPVRKGWNRQSDERAFPCPDDKLPYIQAALKHFGLI